MADILNAPMWDQMQFFCKHIADHQIRLVLHFDRILDENIFKDAVKITIENNPIACANYIENKKEALWRFNAISIDKIYSFTKCQEPKQILQEAVIKQINTISEPQLTISLIRSETDILVLNCNHVITDATGVKDFVNQLAKNYCRISRYIAVEKQNYLPSRSLKILSKKLRAKEKISVIKTMLSSRKKAPSFRRQFEFGNLQNPGFKTYTIHPAQFDKIKKFGKKYSATINDMLLTVYYFSLKLISENSNKTNRLTYSSDLREYLKIKEYDVLSNFSAIHNIDIDNSINDFVSLLEEISSITKTRKRKKYNLADFSLMAILFNTIPYKKLKGIFHKEFDKIKDGKSNTAPSLSNTGIIEETKVNFGSIIPIRAYILGGINHPALLQIVVSSYKKYLTLSIGSYYSEKNKIFISNFIKVLNTTIEEEVLKKANC